MTTFTIDIGVPEASIFSLAGKQLKLDSAADMAPHAEALKAQAKVQKINMSGNTLGIEASRALAEALVQHADTLVEVDFSDIYTGRLNTEIPHSLLHLLPALLRCRKLKVVNLSDNAFGLQTIDPVEAYLAQAVSIEHLVLSNNGMGPFAGARIGKALFRLALAKQHAGEPSLKTFICGRNRLENGSVNNLAVGLRSHKDLHTVRLYQNGIRPAGAEKLVLEGLARNPRLRVLDLQDNTLTTRAAEAVAASLTRWPDLAELNLNDCLLKPKGLLAVAQLLARGAERTGFRVLKLQYNELEHDAVVALVAALKLLPKLELLELNGNRFDEDSEEIGQIRDRLEASNGELDELDDLEELDSDEEDDDSDDEDSFDDMDAALSELEAEWKAEFAQASEAADGGLDSITDKLSGVHIK